MRRRLFTTIIAALRRVGKSVDEGAATAEFAVVLPAVVVVALLLMCLTRTVVVSMDCQDAAAAAARELVVAGDDADPSATARVVAGDDVSVSVARDSDLATVTVQCPVVPDPIGVLPTNVTGKATGVLS
ncbi:TadE family type IV pilus minor pilin [Bifidobacterium biavatii]|uniref:Pilus biosynthesis protein TadE n=1 Tax=Bifidobacterium biavatii DSM 23969 TaxID=1437608 RepID=A0A086ZN84_9BIFI|nr:TadE family type IV pilus minor pilin [Bifidobacterium biavatii]KFI47984.1 pilus biosynthesis protein TadE [Bifidobacterium biavatii DSM 23969]